VLIALTIVAYANSFRTGFTYDSRQLILQDARVQAATADNVRQILQHTYWWPYGESGLYRPLTTFTYLINYSVLGAGERAGSYHALNVLLHMCNVLLVWLLVRCVTQEEDTSFAAAAIWAVLPVSVEAVTNIAGRADLLAGSGVLSALVLYAAFRRASGRHRVLCWLGISTAIAIAVFSKENGIVAAPLIVCAELALWDRRVSAKRLAAIAAAMALPLIVWWIARSSVLREAPAAEFPFMDNPIVGAGWIVGRLTAIKVAGLYLWKLAWPATLSADYSFNAIPLARGSAQDWLTWTTVAGCLAAMIAGARRHRSAAFFAAFAIVAFLPASNLLFASGTIFGERLLYLPSVGLVALAAAALSRLPRPVFVTAAALLVVAFAVRTWTRNPDWTSDVTLWRAAVAAEPSSAKAHHALADALYASDPAHANLDIVIGEQERAVAILDAVPDDHNALAVFRQAGAYRLDKATALGPDGRPEYERALIHLKRAAAIVDARLKPRAPTDRATTDGAPTDGAGSFSRATAPEADVNRLLASAYLGVHDAEHAIDAATRARDLEPLAPLPYRQIATAQLARQDPDAAAITLMAGSMVTSDRGLTQALLGLYAAGLDERECAASGGPSGPTLNTACDVVQRHFCAAAPEAARLDRQLGRFTEAERVETTARTMTSCAAK
jgi:hypothetical protein